MGFLDQVVGALGGAQGGGPAGGQGELLNAVLGMLGHGSPAGQGGGLAELVARFQQGGLGDIVSSWISTGQNLPISADQLHSVLGQDTIDGLAQRTGMASGDLTAQLSQLLPQVVDRLTPHGQLPQGGLGDIGGLLAGLIRR